MIGCRRGKKWRRRSPGGARGGARVEEQEQLGEEMQEDVSRGKKEEKR